MTELLKIEGKAQNGVPVITVSYGPDQMLESGSALGDQLVKEYNEVLEKDASVKGNPSVVVEIQADTAGSPLIRGLVKLHKSVLAHKGQLICIGYPLDFLPSLSSLGVLDLPGFTLGSGLPDAIKRAAVKKTN